MDAVKKRLEKLRGKLAKDLTLMTFNDDSLNIRAKLRIVFRNAGLGLFLVLLVLMLILNFRMALVTALGLPVAVLGGIAAIWMWGFTINTLVVLGMIVVLGMLVGRRHCRGRKYLCSSGERATAMARRP